MKAKPFFSIQFAIKTGLAATAAIVLLASLQSARAAAATWTGAVSGTFGTTGNWSGIATTPANNDSWVFGAAGPSGTSLTNNLAPATVTGITYNAGASAFTISGSNFTLTTGVFNNSGTTQTINDIITWSIASSAVNSAISGNGDVIFGGAVTSSVSGGPTFLFNNTLTNFAGGFGMSTAAGQRTNTFGGAGNVSITNLNNGLSTNLANIFNWSNSGTLTLNGASVAGAFNLNAGTTLLTGNYLSTAGAAGTFTVGSGATIVTSPTGTNSGNAMLRIIGSQNLGTVGVGNTTLTIKGGTTGTGQGTLSLVDNSINTLTINNATASSTLLTMAGGAGLSSILNMEIGNNTADNITLANTGKISVGAGGVVLNITGIGGFNSGASTQNLTLISAAGGGVNGSLFTGNYNTGNFGGYTTATLANSTSTALILTLSGLTAAPTTAYWKGGIDGIWATLTSGTANNSNWTTDAAGTTDAHQVAGATSAVVFSASTPGTTATTLGADFSIKSLTFNSDASVSGTRTLTVSNTSTGITANSGAIGTINAALTGTTGVAKNGVGALVLGGNNTFTGGLTINDGIVRVASAGALNSSTPQAVTFGASAPSTAKLQLNGNSVTIGALSTNATPGTPIVENASGSNATLTVSQSTNTTYAGTLQDGTGGGNLGLAKTGSGTLTLSGNNSYTGATAVNNGALLVDGNSASATGAVSVASGAVLGGAGTVGGATTISSGGFVTGGAIGSAGTLTFANGLSLNAGSIGYFDLGDYINLTGGGLTVGNGAILRVTSGLAAGDYNLIGLNGSSITTSNFVLQYFNGNAAAGTYALGTSGGNLVLTVTGATAPIPSISLIAPASGARVMQSTVLGVSGTVENVGSGTLNGAITDNGGNLTATSITPSTTSLGASAATGYTASVNSGTVLGNRTISIAVTDTNATPTTASATNSISVLQNRVVTSSTVASFGSVHQGATVSGTTVLTSPGADDSNTRVTVANSGTDANGILVTGGTNPVFNGSTSDTRTVSGTISTLGNVNGAITLVTTGEAGVAGTQTPVNVTVNYSASVYSGKAAWTAGANGDWLVGGNWADTQGGGVAGSPGVDGALSVGDTATFGNVTGSPANLTVSLNGTSPSLAGITFNSTQTAYTIAQGTSGAITLQGSATPIDVSTSLSPTISAPLAGLGLSKTGTGTLILAGANTYTGTTAIANGAIQVTSGNDRLPTTSAVVLGSGTTSGKLILGDASSARNQTIGGLTTAGSGTANSVVGGNAATSILTVNVASGTSVFAGTVGGVGTNENNLALAKTGAGVLSLTGNNTYIGGTLLTAGTLNVGSAGAIGTNAFILFGGGTLQYSAANTTDYSSGFFTSGNSAFSIDTNGQNVTFATGLSGSGVNGLNKTGAGVLTLASSGNTYTGVTNIGGGVLASSDALTNSVNLTGGVWRPILTSDTLITGTLGVSTGAGALNGWSSGGFAAKGAKLTVTVNGGADLAWGTGGFMGGGVTPMIFGSPSADNQVEVTNNINLNTADTFQRIITVNAGAGGDSALLSGIISGGVTGTLSNTGFKKQGDGILILSGSNTYQGTTTINAGTLIAGGNSLAGSAGVFGTGTGSITNPTAPSAIELDATTGASPSLKIGGAFTVSRAVTVNNTVTTGTYSIGGSTDSNATFAGLVTFSQPLSVTQVATTGTNALNISGGLTGGANALLKTVRFDNVGTVNVSNTGISDGAGGGKVAVIKSNTGTTNFSAANTYTGTTTVSAGTLLVSGAGNINTSAAVSITGGTLDYQNNTTGLNRNVTVNGGTFKNNSTQNFTGSLTFTAGTVGGTNLAGIALSIGTGQTLSPGNSPGTLTSGAQTWASGGNYNWQILDATGSAGTGFDTIALTTGSALNITATALGKFNINLWSLSSTGPDVNGNAQNFSGASNYSWTLIATDQAITGFSADEFLINIAAANGTSGFSNSASGTFAVALADGNTDLVLTYTAVPEPGTFGLIALGLAGLFFVRRRAHTA
ncbi:hypothetical protein BH09VER1_BH09VER1_34670 [soil metagenome]